MPIRLIPAISALAIAALSAPAFAQPAETAPAPAAGAAKPVTAQGDTLATLKLSGQFNNFVKAVDATNLSTLLKTPNITVFAPTDAAFAAMPAGEFDRLLADKARLQKFVIHHVINAQVPAAKIKGTKGEWPSVAGDKILLDGSEEGALKADGATIVQPDVKTATGLLHVVDRALVAGEGAREPALASAETTAGAAQPAGDAGTKARQ